MKGLPVKHGYELQVKLDISSEWHNIGKHRNGLWTFCAKCWEMVKHTLQNLRCKHRKIVHERVKCRKKAKKIISEECRLKLRSRFSICFVVFWLQSSKPSQPHKNGGRHFKKIFSFLTIKNFLQPWKVNKTKF